MLLFAGEQDMGAAACASELFYVFPQTGEPLL
jgi:hypothetical protein